MQMNFSLDPDPSQYIKVANNLVSGRDIHRFLESRQKYTEWVRTRIKGLNLSQQKDFFVKSGNIPEHKRGRRPIEDYEFTLDAAKKIGMAENTKKGEQVREYFLKMEGVAHQSFQQPNDSEKFRFFNMVLEEVAKHSPTAKLTLAAKISKEAFGIEIPQSMLPRIDEQRWSASEIAAEINRSPQIVGKIAGQLGLKQEPYSVQRLSIALHTNKEIPMHYYNADAKQRIIKYLTGL